MSDLDSLAAAFDPLPFERRELFNPDGAYWTRRRAQARTYAERLLASGWLAEHDREVREAERERILRAVRDIPAWGTLEEREDHGGFDVPGQNPRALVFAAIRGTSDGSDT
jgi:hypothetical protein